MDRDDAKRLLGFLPEKRHILFAANPLVPVKRHWLARAAAQRIQDEFGAELVELYGVSHKRVPAYMNACDVLLLTSEHEGSPTVVKEALACGLPIVAVDVGDVRERIGGVEGCVVCSDDSPTTIADGLAHVLRQNRRVEGRGEVGDLDERVVTREVIAVYRSALDRTSSFSRAVGRSP